MLLYGIGPTIGREQMRSRGKRSGRQRLVAIGASREALVVNIIGHLAIKGLARRIGIVEANGMQAVALYLVGHSA